MTINEVSKQLYNLSVDGTFNGAHYTRASLAAHIRTWMRPEISKSLCCPDHLLMTIRLSDGDWYFTVNQYRPGEFDYTTPDTRQQEAELLSRYGIESQPVA